MAIETTKVIARLKSDQESGIALQAPSRYYSLAFLVKPGSCLEAGFGSMVVAFLQQGKTLEGAVVLGFDCDRDESIVGVGVMVCFGKV